MSFQGSAGRRQLGPLVLGLGVVAALAAAGCGEKSEPAVHPPTTAAITTTPTATAPAVTTTAPANTSAAPAPTTTP